MFLPTEQICFRNLPSNSAISGIRFINQSLLSAKKISGVFRRCLRALFSVASSKMKVQWKIFIEVSFEVSSKCSIWRSLELQIKLLNFLIYSTNSIKFTEKFIDRLRSLDLSESACRRIMDRWGQSNQWNWWNLKFGDGPLELWRWATIMLR